MDQSSNKNPEISVGNLIRLRLAAERGDAMAQYTFGLYYYTGVGGEEDEAEAVKWFFKAVEQDFAPAQ